MSAEFVHLHVHSEYSLLDGLPHPHELAERAQEHGQSAIALTDHGTMFAAIEFHDACRQVGVKPLIGLEAYLAARRMQDRDNKLDRSSYHLLLLAENETGYHNLMKLATAAQLEGFYYYPRVDKQLLAQRADGIIATTGCLAAEIPQLLLNGRRDAARETLAWYRDVFKDRFYIELQDHGIADLTRVNQELFALADEFNLKTIATNDVHYLQAEDWFAQDILLCIQTNTTVTATDRMKMDGRDYYFKSTEEMAALWSERPEALKNTLEVAERCTLDLTSHGYHLPFFPVPKGYTPQSYLRALCEQGLTGRYGNNPRAEIRERFEYELGVIHQMGFDTYFLIVWDLTRHAREKNIWFNVRGSAASSIVAYCLGITNLDPLEQRLVFERFLNPGRISMPDIDLDFPDDARDEMIRYTVNQYGKENVAQIITFGKLLAKAAIRDVGRALDYPLGEVDRVAKLIPMGPGQTIEHSLEKISEFRALYESSDYIKKLIDNARLLEGVARHASTHAAGVVVADKPIVEYTPLHRPTRNADTGFAVTQYPMGDLEHIGLLKIDFLGLSTLTIMRRACELIEKRHGAHFDLNNIPVEDEEAFKLLSRGDVTGVFQVEGAGLRQVLTKMKPYKFDHIVAAISLYRPGPMDYIPTYIKRMHGEEAITYAHPSLEHILDETYGVCVSGDAIVADTRTGQRMRLDHVGGARDIYLQGVDADLNPAVGRVLNWVHNGRKSVFEVRLRNGAHIKATTDHRLLTENGWRRLADLKVGDYVATPPELVAQEESFDRRKLRVLAYLLADGDLSNLASVNFVSKDPLLLNEYEKCLTAFDNVMTSRLAQIRGVTRITTSKADRMDYHAPSELLAWLRELGLKHPPRVKPGGARSAEKFVPEFVFALDRDHIAFFLASLWDCDGYVGAKFWHYRTISLQLAEDVQTLLLKLGIPSSIYTAPYLTTRGARISHQVTVYDTARLAQWVCPHLISDKKKRGRDNHAETTLAREPLITELEATTTLSKRALMNRFGIDTQHFKPRGRQRQRISTHVIAHIAEQLNLQETQRKMRVRWEEIVSIKPAGLKDVYDVTVEGIHNFVANNIIVHNCVYQEQILRMAMDLCGYSGPEADLLRKAVGKKKKEELLAQREKFVQGAMIHGNVPGAIANKLFDDLEFFARYGFNKAHGADYAVLTCQTAYLKAHYPLEYMCALMVTETGNIEKIAILIADARRMGIPVLPPDVRYSGVEFEIQPSPPDASSRTRDSIGIMSLDGTLARRTTAETPGRAATRDVSRDDASPTPTPYNGGEENAEGIRFGLSAIKNVGVGPVEVIVKARGDTSFASLDDFCRRVDLRQVNRRVLESLIKAGAFDAFGHRAQLVQVIDRMISSSASAHQASALGQMSFFGTTLQADTFSQLPNVKEADNREQLEWEKELMGVYFSQHPLLQIAQLGSSRQLTTHFVGDLSEQLDGHVVTLGGMILSTRTIPTKKGDTMAFAQLEDPQGTVEVVAFPRTYNAARELLREETLVLVTGKVQVRDSKLAILADTIKAYAVDAGQQNRARDAETNRPLPGILEQAPRKPVGAVNQVDADGAAFDDWLPPPEDMDLDDADHAPAPAAVIASGEIAVAEIPSAGASAGASTGANANAPGEILAATSNDDAPEETAAPLPDLNLRAGISIPSKANGGSDGTALANGESVADATSHQVVSGTLGAMVASQPAQGNGGVTPNAADPVTPTYSRPVDSGRLLRVHIQRTDDSDLDTRRMRELVRLLRSAEGRDRFSLIVPHSNGKVLLDFPNFFTNYEAVADSLGEMIAEWGELEVQ